MRRTLALPGERQRRTPLGTLNHLSAAGLVGRLAASIAAWVGRGCKTASLATPSLRIVERIPLAPRQSLALIEADGRRLLVATCPDGPPSLYALDRAAEIRPRTSRVTW